MPEKAYALVFSPHPDDAEGGAGGTIIRWSREGKRVVLVTCTNGDKGTNDPDITPEELVKMRVIEQQAAAKILGVSEVVALPYSDQTLGDTPEFREVVTRLIRQYKPDVVLTTDFERKYRNHPDHRATGRVVMDAVSLYSRNLPAFPDLYFKEGLELHECNEVLFWGSESPNYCLDITDVHKEKLAARDSHFSQFGEPSPEKDERMMRMFKMHARNEDFEYGEAFYRIDMNMPPFAQNQTMK